MPSKRAILHELRDKLIGDIQEGYITLTLKEISLDTNEELYSILDQFMAQFEYRPLGKNWIEAQRGEAMELLQYALSRHPHLLPLEIRSLEESRVLTEIFFSLFDDEARYFTNGVIDKNQELIPIRYERIGNGEFDTGVIGLDSHHIGVLWIEDFI